MNNKNKKKTIMLLILILLIIGIGYATLKSTLTIDGTTTIKNNNFIIKFANIVQKSGSIEPTTAAKIGTGETSITFDVVLEHPGDYYGFSVDVINSGSLNAEIESFEMTQLSASQQKYLTYEITYNDGTNLKVGDYLAKGKTKTINVYLGYKENPEELPSKSEQTLSFKFKLNYIESNYTNPYEGQTVSVLGDSISTLKGYIPSTNRPRYVQTEAEAVDGLLYMPYEETWWGQVINDIDAELGINDSWAGSTVSNVSTTNSGDLGPDAAMASMTRIEKLDDNGTPDLILFYGGTNDIGHSRTIGTFDSTASYATTVDTTTTVYSTFTEAYTMAILRMKYLYPDAEIVSILPTYTSSYYTNDKLAQYNEAIKVICDYYDIKYVDLRLSGMTTEHLADGIHPNATGMDYISSYITKQITTIQDAQNTITPTVRETNNTHAQNLPENLTSETNLYTALTPEVGYFNQTEWLNQVSGYEVVSITIPVVPGDKIKSSSFDAANPLQPSSKGIRVTYLKDNTIVKSLAANETYAEYSTNGYITVPEGVNTICIPWWFASDDNWANILID